MSQARGDSRDLLEAWVLEWRARLRELGVGSDALAELEERLRETAADLAGAGLAADEAALVAIRRLSSEHGPTSEFARENAGGAWAVAPAAEPESGPTSERSVPEVAVVFALAVAAAAALKLAGLADAASGEGADDFYARNSAFFPLPWLTVYLAWRRRLGWRLAAVVGLAFAVPLALANLYPYEADGMTFALTVIHTPLALWLVVGMVHTGGKWSSPDRRTAFVRFTGTVLICYGLIALGGGLLTGLSIVVFHSIGLDLEQFAETWILPCGAMGAVVVSAWLAETKRGLVGVIPQSLARIFTPLLLFLFVAFLVTMAATGQGIDLDREMLIAFDVLLVLVVCLLLYSLSARASNARPGWVAHVQLALVIAALVVDVVALVAIAGRISEYGASANKLAALAENLILLVNLVWSAWLYVRLHRGEVAITAVERWQTGYLPVYAAWAAIVVMVLPPMFGFR